MTILEQAFHLTGQLSLVEKATLLEYLSSELKQAIEANGSPPVEEAVDAMGYPIGYFEQTYGSFAEDPLKRDQPMLSDERDELE